LFAGIGAALLFLAAFLCGRRPGSKTAGQIAREKEHLARELAAERQKAAEARAKADIAATHAKHDKEVDRVLATDLGSYLRRESDKR
jgi:type II secretory pathway component PulM